MRTDPGDPTDDALLDECERLYEARLTIPWWRPIKRYRADNAWLSTVAVLQSREVAEAKLRQAAGR